MTTCFGCVVPAASVPAACGIGAPSEAHFRKSAMTRSFSLPFGGMLTPSGKYETDAISKLVSGSPGETTGPESPPAPQGGLDVEPQSPFDPLGAARVAFVAVLR